MDGLGFIIMIYDGASFYADGWCMYVCIVFFFRRERKGKKRKGENYCSRHPKSPVFNFRSARVSFAEEDDLDRDVVSVC